MELSAAGADASLFPLITLMNALRGQWKRAATRILQGVVAWRVPMGYAFAGVYIILARPASWGLFGLTAALVILGCALRSWAAGYLIKGKRVAVGGPYAYVRNPLYIGSFIIGVGCCVALWKLPLPVTSVLLWGVFLIAFGVVYPVKVKAEEVELRASLNGAYQVYEQKVPAFVPWKGQGRGLGEQRFCGNVYRRNREYQCLLGGSGLLALLFIKYLGGV